MTDTENVSRAYELLNPCRVCPRHCHVDRPAGEVGACGIGAVPLVSSSGPHFGEESCLVGRGGSGTVFLTGCNLGCVFCQNYDISHRREGRPVPVDVVTETMLSLERAGCENVNLVSPTHVGPQMLDAICRARDQGLSVPIVWNCGGYESLEMLELLDGAVQIYMPDVKYADNATAERLSGVKGYWDVVRAALREMHRQVGDLDIRDDVARRGLLVRHLVLPNGRAGSDAVIDFLADEISDNTFINVMGQYRPVFQAAGHEGINRLPSRQEIQAARDHAASRGLRLDKR